MVSAMELVVAVINRTKITQTLRDPTIEVKTEGTHDPPTIVASFFVIIVDFLLGSFFPAFLEFCSVS